MRLNADELDEKEIWKLNREILDKKREVSPQEQELKALQKELREFKMERWYIKKGVSIFSKSGT